MGPSELRSKAFLRSASVQAAAGEPSSLSLRTDAWTGVCPSAASSSKETGGRSRRVWEVRRTIGGAEGGISGSVWAQSKQRHQGSIRDEGSRLPICREASLFFCSGWVSPVYCCFASYNLNSAAGNQTREEQKERQLLKARAQSGRYQK